MIESLEEIQEVIIYDLNGALISKSINTNRIKSPLINGVYFVQIRSKDKYSIQKLVVAQ